MSRSLYIEPALIEFCEEDTPHIQKERFIVQLRNVLKLIETLNYTVLLDAHLLKGMGATNPTKPFDISKIKDYRMKILASDINKNFNKVLFSRIKEVVHDKTCMLEESILFSTENQKYLDFYNFLISECPNIETEVSTDIILKVNMSDFFDEYFVIACNSDCGQPFEKTFRCFDHVSLVNSIQENKIIVKKKELFESIFKLQGIHYSNISISRDGDHHPIFKKMKKFADIENPVKTLFINLHRIVGLQHISFKDFSGSTVTNESTGIIFDQSDPILIRDGFCQVKATLGLPNKPGRPNSCNIIMDMHHDNFNKLMSYMELQNSRVLTIKFLGSVYDEYNKS